MIIETERLILRPFRENDARDVYEYLKSPVVHCFEDMRLNTYDEAVALMKSRKGETEYDFAIALKENGKVIGEISAHPEIMVPGVEISDTYSPIWMLNQAYGGKGYAYEAAKAVYDYLFYQKGARRIFAYTEDYNKNSQHLCEKLGMRKEGTFVEFVSFINDDDGNPIYENTIQYAILKKEWEKR